MAPSEALEEVVTHPVCGLCQKNGTPIHAILHPLENSGSEEEHRFCCDSRSDNCPYSEIRDNRRYCRYKK